MNKNWWDLVGLIGRSNDLNPILSKEGSLHNSTNLNLPDWVLQRLDDFVDNVIKNGFTDLRYFKYLIRIMKIMKNLLNAFSWI